MTQIQIPASLQRIRGIQPFSTCTDGELAFIANRTCDHIAPAGALLTEEGRTGREWIVIVEGTAVVRVGTRQVARLGPGDAIGEVSLLDHGPQTATVVAETDVQALVSSASEFADILSSVPSVARSLLVGCARRLRATDDILTPATAGAPLAHAAQQWTRGGWTLR